MSSSHTSSKPQRSLEMKGCFSGQLGPLQPCGAGGACKEHPANPPAWGGPVGSPALQDPRHGEGLGHTHPEMDAEIAWRDQSDHIICHGGIHVTQATKIKAVWASPPTSKLPALHTNSFLWLCCGTSPGTPGGRLVCCAHSRTGSHRSHPAPPLSQGQQEPGDNTTEPRQGLVQTRSRQQGAPSSKHRARASLWSSL